MKRLIINLSAFAVGYCAGKLAYKVLTMNPMWFKQFAPAPESVPEWMVREAREKGGM